MTFTAPSGCIHPIMTACRQREHRQWTARLKDGGHHARQRKALHVDRQDGCFRPCLFQERLRLLGAARLPHNQLDVSQLLFRFGKPSFHCLHLLAIGAPSAIVRYGIAREDNTDPRFATRLRRRRLGSPRPRPRRTGEQQPTRGACPQKSPSRALFTHRQVLSPKMTVEPFTGLGGVPRPLRQQIKGHSVYTQVRLSRRR